MKITKDLVLFITGGSSGLGEETVRLFSSLGCKVAVADVDVERMNQLKQEQALSGDNIIWIPCDVSVESQVKDAVQ